MNRGSAKSSKGISSVRLSSCLPHFLAPHRWRRLSLIVAALQEKPAAAAAARGQEGGQPPDWNATFVAELLQVRA
jgi:hypothetical protein